MLNSSNHSRRMHTKITKMVKIKDELSNINGFTKEENETLSRGEKE